VNSPAVRGGLSGLSVSLGAYLNPDVAIMGRAAGTSFWTKDGSKQQIVNAVYGVSTIDWIGDFYLGGGAGVALYGKPYGASSQSLTGLGLDLRAGTRSTTAPTTPSPSASRRPRRSTAASPPSGPA
jgi:hypothetical protein